MAGYFKNAQEKNHTISVGILENTSKQLSDAINNNREQFCYIRNDFVEHIYENYKCDDKAHAKRTAKARLSMFEKEVEHGKTRLSMSSSDSSKVVDSQESTLEDLLCLKKTFEYDVKRSVQVKQKLEHAYARL